GRDPQGTPRSDFAKAVRGPAVNCTNGAHALHVRQYGFRFGRLRAAGGRGTVSGCTQTATATRAECSRDENKPPICALMLTWLWEMVGYEVAATAQRNGRNRVESRHP